jgi:hypothetical protein
MAHRPFLYLARYKQKTNTTVEGVAKSGQVSPQGIVAHSENWEGRVSSLAAPSAIRYLVDPDGHVRPMTMKEMIDRGYFHLASGPTGVRHIKEGINERQDRKETR